MAKKEMSEHQFETIISQEIKDAVGYMSDQIAADRETATRYYNGEKFGDEQVGRSQVVSRDVLDTIESALPSLLRIFAAGDDVVEYMPRQPEDEAGAKQATDAANYVFYVDNPGFRILYAWFKDALLSKVGVVKSWWHEETKYETTTLTGLDEAAFTAIVGEDEVEVLAHTQNTIDTDSGPYVTHDVTIKRKCAYGKVCIEGVPPEEFLISSRSRDKESARFVGHKKPITRSELIEMGFDKDCVESIGSSDENDTGEREARFDDESQGGDSTDKSTEKLQVVEGYILVDRNGDGVAELNQFWAAGSGAWKILTKDGKPAIQEVDRDPFSTLCPVPIPHKFFGKSLAEMVTDIQLIKSTLWRQMLDNLYLSNNPEREVDVTKVVNMDDFLMCRPGGLKRVKAIGATREVKYPFTAGASFEMLSYLDTVKESRTGSSPTVSADAEALQNQSATAVSYSESAKTQRIELIARVFAETGVKELFRNILKLMVKHQDKPRMIRLRNKWVPIDPRYWDAEMDVSISVGLGHGNRDRQGAHIMAILTMQKEALAAGGVGGMVTPKNIYNGVSAFVNNAGFKNVNAFFNEPSDAPLPQNTAPDPKVQAAMIKSKTDMQTAQMKSENERAKIASEMVLHREDTAAEAQLKREEMMIEAGLKRQDIANKASVSAVRMGGKVG